MRVLSSTHILLGFVALPIDLVGTLGNLALLFVLSQRRRCDKPMYIILRWMSVTNVLLLVLNMNFQALPAIWQVTNTMAAWFRFAAVYGFYITPVASAAHFLKVWLTVLLSVERWTAVCCPLKFKSRFSNKRVQIFIALTFLAAVAFNMPRYFETDCVSVRSVRNMTGNMTLPRGVRNISSNSSVTVTRSLRCAPQAAFFQSAFYRYGYGVAAYSLFVFLLPVGTALVLNCHIIYEIHKGNSTLAVLTIVQKFERRISKVPLAMAIVFCVLQSPAMCVNILHFAGWAESSGMQNTHLWKSMLGMAVVLIMLDSFADFILYFYNMNCSCSVFVDSMCRRRRSRACRRDNRLRTAMHTKTSSEIRYNVVTVNSCVQESWLD